MTARVTTDTNYQIGEPTLRHCWHVITSEYPPQTGGIADYTRLLARRLADLGDEVHVWCPSLPETAASGAGINVHPRLGRFSPADLRGVSRELDRYPGPRRLLVQWVPHGYGCRSLNVAFCLWLWRRVRRHRDRLDLVVHEAYLLFRATSVRHSAASLVHRLMAIILLNAASRAWVAIPTWESRLKPYALGRRLPFRWLPIFSNIPVAGRPDQIRILRQQYAGANSVLIGHFGTYGSRVTKLLDPILLALAEDSSVRILLMGIGSEQYCCDLVQKDSRLKGVVHPTGNLSPEDLSSHLSVCDMLIQPYPDGVSTRRGSLMAGLSHGKAIVTTIGELTEPFWEESRAALLVPVGDTAGYVNTVRRLCHDREERERVASAALELYKNRFDISRVIAALRQTAAESSLCAS